MISIPGGQFGEEGSENHFAFPVQHVMTQLPCPLNLSELILSSVSDPEREPPEPVVPHHRDHSASTSSNRTILSVPAKSTTNKTIRIDTSDHSEPLIAKPHLLIYLKFLPGQIVFLEGQLFHMKFNKS